MPAVFVSRFLPGVRAIVPAFAGALRLPVVMTTLMIASASAIWYGIITVVAFRVGADWERLSAVVARYRNLTAMVAAVVALLGLVAWLALRNRRRQQ
jgi:membrane protein DedA with SNARE-associated domain